MKVINLSQVCFNYENDEDNKILKDIDLEIEQGEFLAIIGHNGSGKSTLAKLLNALMIPNSGDVFVYGMNTKDEEKTLDIRQKVSMVFQNPDNQMVTTIVEEDVAFGPENLGIESKEIRRRVDEALKAVNMSEFAKHSPEHLSGGQKQRIAIAGAYAMQSDIIVFDEPTAMLDPAGREEVLNAILQMNKQKGITIVLITHFMEEAAKADRVVVLNDGEIIINGKPAEIFKQTDRLTKLGLEVPFSVRLSDELKNRGCNINNILDENEMVKEICQLISKI